LVVHRDLKPQNILVTPQGLPKLLVFGIGKLLNSSQPQAGGDYTATLLPIMTPDYASPEQVRNEAITTATDVYSLGAILYVLLTGRRPYRVNTTSLNEIVNAICSTEPEKPSAAVMHHDDDVRTDSSSSSPDGSSTVGSSAGDAEKLRRTLSGDLDNIVLKALRKEPSRRYASVDQLSEDIRRYLQGLPVNAAGGTLQYRARKFVRRHQAAVAAAILIAIGLTAGAAAIVREARIARFQQQRAERRFQDVRALANSLMFDVHGAIKDLPGATKARKLLVDRALHYLDGLASDEGNDLSLQKNWPPRMKRLATCRVIPTPQIWATPPARWQVTKKLSRFENPSSEAVTIPRIPNNSSPPIIIASAWFPTRAVIAPALWNISKRLLPSRNAF